MTDQDRFGRYSAGETLGAREGSTFYRIGDPAAASRCLVAVLFGAADEAARANLAARGEAALAAAKGGDRVIEVGREFLTGRVFVAVELAGAPTGPQCFARASAVIAANGLEELSAEEAWLGKVDVEALYADAILADAPDTATLVTYVSNRATLTADQVASIEAYLAASEFHRARLNQLRQRVEPVALARGPVMARGLWAEAAIAGRADASATTPGSSKGRRVLLIAAGALAVAAVWLLVRWLL